MHRLQALDGCLTLMDDLRASIESGLTNEDVLSIANTLPVEQIRSITNERLIDNVLLARSVFKPNPYYGTRLAADQQVLIDVDELGAGDIDLFMTDRDGITKNRVSDDNTQQRRDNARATKKKVITFFGGSTIMGTGSRLPAFTIPSLVEQILLLKHRIETVCINRGILGMTSQDSFNMLTADELCTPPDYVVFYTGWNCVFNQSAIRTLLNDEKKSKIFKTYPGMSTRHIEHGMQLGLQFDSSAAWKRAIWITINSALVRISKLLNSKKIRKVLNSLLKSDPTVNQSFVPEIIEEISHSDTDKIAIACAEDYLRLSRLAHACCESEGVKFLNFIQPCLSWGNKKMTPTEQEFKNSSPPMGGVQSKFYTHIASASSPEYFHDLGHIFDSVQRQVYIDTGHLNPYGNFIVAEKIADQIAIELK
jgi:hypothetical protein